MNHTEIEKSCLDYFKRNLNNDIYYGCPAEDLDLIKRIFLIANSNPDPNKFPDFTFDGGFVEHFEVTSSHSDRKGSKMKKEQYALQKEAEEKEKNLIEAMSKNLWFEDEPVVTSRWHSNNSHKNFVLSFERNFEKHIGSLDKYTGDKSIGVFMIQYNDSALTLYRVCYNSKSGLLSKVTLESGEYKGYRITHDSEILEYIYQFRKKIKYVAFFNNDRFYGEKGEIICLENIPEILKEIKGKYNFQCRKVGTAYTLLP